MKKSDKALSPGIKVSQTELEFQIPRTLRTEFNFLKFPFFDLAKNSQRSEIKIEEWVDTKDGKMHIFWQVTRDIKSQFPGEFEKRLHRAIEQILNAHPKPITNPLRLGSLRYIARLMGIHADSGKNYRDIQKAFKNIVKTSIEANGTFQVKEDKSKRYISDTFHLYERVIFKGEQLPDGSFADSVYLMLGSWYLNNINNNYVVPLDWRFYNRLSGSITTRMYEYMSIYFFTALERGYSYYDARYSQLCNYFPIKPQYPRWKARKQLKKAHESLVDAAYFADVEWMDAHDAKDWLLRYWIGPKAREEYENNKKEFRAFGVNSGRPVLIPERRHRANRGGEQLSIKFPQGSELCKRGLSESVAIALSQNHSEAYIAHKIAVFDWLVAVKSKLVSENSAGFLRRSIEENYNDPPGYVPEAERRRRQFKAERQQRKREWQRKIEEYKAWLSSEPRHKVYWNLMKWEKAFKEAHGRPPTSEEVVNQQNILIGKLPSNDAIQREIFGKAIFQSATVEELENELKSHSGAWEDIATNQVETI